MKPPPQFYQSEGLMDQFVVAADTTIQVAACDLLFIHGNDLTWGAPEHGYFLPEIFIDDEFERIIEIVEARSNLSVKQLAKLSIQQIQPKLLEWLKNAGPQIQAGDGNRTRTIASAISNLDLETTFGKLNKIGPEIFRQWPLFADGIASWLIKGARSLYQRQLSVTGMTGRAISVNG